ncbi:MAG TPA: hypothetical protein VF190_03375, partial [Rhodothermales bacterium]
MTETTVEPARPDAASNTNEMEVPVASREQSANSLRHRHLLGLATYTAPEINLILDTAREFREVLGRSIKRVPTLRGITIV